MTCPLQKAGHRSPSPQLSPSDTARTVRPVPGILVCKLQRNPRGVRVAVLTVLQGAVRGLPEGVHGRRLPGAQSHPESFPVQHGLPFSRVPFAGEILSLSGDVRARPGATARVSPRKPMEDALLFYALTLGSLNPVFPRR